MPWGQYTRAVSQGGAGAGSGAETDGEAVEQLSSLVALSPAGLAEVNATVRRVCAATVGLPPLPVEDEAGTGGAGPAVTEFAEQFAADVSALTPQLREAFVGALGDRAFAAAALVFIADFAPRAYAGLDALGIAAPRGGAGWDHDSDPADLLLNGFAPTVARMHALDPVTSEMVRLRGAAAHNCRLCRSLRDGSALDAGGSEMLYGEIADYESSAQLSERHKAALRYADALIWAPFAVGQPADDVREHFSDAEAVELTLDVMRNASNKIAVALGADAPRVQSGVERYEIGDDGQPIYG